MLLYAAMKCYGVNDWWGTALVSLKQGTQPAAVDKNLGDSARVISNKTYGSRALIKLFMGRRL